MSAPIWQKTKQAVIDDSIMHYMASDDVELDKQIILFDIQASKAHVKGLLAIDIISQKESQQLLAGLEQLASEYANGAFELNEFYEDCHSAIEHYLVNHLGDIGKKVHTGRSRNDQVLVATRLMLKHTLNQATQIVNEIIDRSLHQARQTKDIVMPGYTHMQRAVPSSCGMWFASIAESMIDNLIGLKACLELVDCNPLGTAAGYGVNLPLDRELTTKELDFDRIQFNPIYAQNSRGKFEISVLNALSQCLLDVRRYCWDLSLFTTQEYNFATLPDEMTTGSSIMPNKKNPDLVELMRANYASIQSAVVELQSILSLPSGYQRDLQLTKGPTLRGIKAAIETLQLFPRLIAGLEFNRQPMLEAIDAPMHATDLAVELSAEGVPFRHAYQQVVEEYSELESRSAQGSIRKRVSPGACADLQLKHLKQRWNELNS